VRVGRAAGPRRLRLSSRSALTQPFSKR
jgi:hypothetical protein